MKVAKISWSPRRINLYDNGDLHIFLRHNDHPVQEYAILIPAEEQPEFLRRFEDWSRFIGDVICRYGTGHVELPIGKQLSERPS